jgi:hypothetical protein
MLMPRRPRTVGIESALDLARKAEILERELATQREAMERLKQMGTRQSNAAPQPLRPARTA